MTTPRSSSSTATSTASRSGTSASSTSRSGSGSTSSSAGRTVRRPRAGSRAASSTPSTTFGPAPASPIWMTSTARRATGSPPWPTCASTAPLACGPSTGWSIGATASRRCRQSTHSRSSCATTVGSAATAMFGGSARPTAWPGPGWARPCRSARPTTWSRSGPALSGWLSTRGLRSTVSASRSPVSGTASPSPTAAGGASRSRCSCRWSPWSSARCRLRRAGRRGCTVIALEQARLYLSQLGLTHAAHVLDSRLDAATHKQLPYPDLLADLLGLEVAARRERYLRTRTNLTHFPFHRTLDQFDFASSALGRRAPGPRARHARLRRRHGQPPPPGSTRRRQDPPRRYPRRPRHRARSRRLFRARPPAPRRPHPRPA